MFNVLADNDTIRGILQGLERAEDIAVDTETSGLNVRNNVDYLMGVCVDIPGLAAYIPFRHKERNVDKQWLTPLVSILKEKPLIWHNRKFDFHSFATIGVDPLEFKGPQYCTLLIASLINEELYSKELDALAKLYLGKTKYEKEQVHKLAQAVGYANVPPELYKDYGSQDATLTRALRDKLWPELVSQELEAVYWETESPFNDLLFQLERRGVGTFPSFCEEKVERGNGRMATIHRDLRGVNPASPKDLGQFLINELGLPVVAHTKSCEQCTKYKRPVGSHSGPVSFNKAAMEEYDEMLEGQHNPSARMILEYRGWQKAVSSLYLPMLEKVGPDGFIRTEFKQHGTVTGRLSAANPNLQQIPRGSIKVWNGDAKSAFVSGRPEYKLIGWDYSQIELRLAAAYGQEAVLLTEFESPEADPFRVLAPIIFGEFTPETRQDTKTFVYANLYGAGLDKIAATLGRSRDSVEPLYRNYQNGIPGITRVSSQVATLMLQRGFIRYWDGRRRHIRDKSKAYKSWNSLIQGGAAQLTKKAMLRCREFENDECFMVLQVHDEITFVIREDKIPYYEPLIIEAMTDWPDFGVNLAVEGKEWR